MDETEHYGYAPPYSWNLQLKSFKDDDSSKSQIEETKNLSLNKVGTLLTQMDTSQASTKKTLPWLFMRGDNKDIVHLKIKFGSKFHFKTNNGQT